MKTLRNNIYKDIASILCNNQYIKTTRILILLSQTIMIYPSNKSIFCLVCNRMISFYERNIFNLDLIINVMRDEGEDPEIIENVEFLSKNPTIKSEAEVNRLCMLLSDYNKFSKILKAKESFIKALDFIDEDPTEINELHNQIETLVSLSKEIQSAYNSSHVAATNNSFDSNEIGAMKMSIAEAKDSRSPNKCIITGIRGLNNILSPGYLSGCLYVYAALPGNYKSGILLKSHVDTLKYNEHIKKTTDGRTPISMYISMENTMTQTINRLWGVLFPSADMSMFTVDEIAEMINNELTSKGMRSVILYYGYREKSTKDLEDIINSYTDEKNEVIAVYLDYIKRIRPGRTDAAVSQSEKSELHAIMNELKNICAKYNIPIVTGHQLNREAAKQVDDIVKSGGYNKTDQALGRSNISVAWEIMEVADFLALMNIENTGESKALVIKAVKQRDLDNNTDTSISAIRHPFISMQSFALKDDIMENVSISTPIFFGMQKVNYMAAI